MSSWKDKDTYSGEGNIFGNLLQDIRMNNFSPTIFQTIQMQTVRSQAFGFLSK